jgi:penicillin-binding protein 2
MFEGRLKILLYLLGLGAVLLVARLAELQVARGAAYRETAERMLIRPIEYISAVRGRILARNGEVLASEEPSWDICVHYGLISDDPEYLRRLARSMDVDEAALRERVADMWRQLSRLSGMSMDEIDQRRRALVHRVDLIRDDFAERHGYETTMREEVSLHPIVSDLSDGQQVRVRMALDNLPGVEVQAGTTRRYLNDPSLGHLLGRLGQVSMQDLSEDPRCGDILQEYRQDDLRGTAGLEYACEEMLRGSRGQIVMNLDGEVTRRVEPTRGADVVLSLDLDLQQRIYDMLAEAVIRSETATGGAAVILDPASRQVLALVSYPGFAPDDYHDSFEELAEDTLYSPLIWRAVSGQYAPGSIVKPIVLAGALSAGIITPDFTVDCQGSLFPSQPDVWREWRSYVTGQPMRHGVVDGLAAIKNSCQVFFYTVGEKMGGRRLCEWFQMAGFGRSPGLGLIEEALGSVPTPAWLARHTDKRHYYIADGRNYAVGQGELLITPLQAVNLASVYATGSYMPVTLVTNDGRERGAWRLPVSPVTWTTVRRGMWQVVNEPGGTAYRSVKLRNDEYEICGKSGSAETSCRALSFLASWRDADGLTRQQIIPAHTEQQARRRLISRVESDDGEVNGLTLEVQRWWPHPPGAEKARPSHAWFIGFVQPKSDGMFRAGPRPSFAFAVLLEYGGSGGRHAGPVAADVCRMIIEEFPQYVRGEHASYAG